MGGVIVVIAKSANSALELAKNDTKYPDIRSDWYLGKKDDSDGSWYLVESFQSAESLERIVLVDYNEA